jgi:hypothetical protein
MFFAIEAAFCSAERYIVGSMISADQVHVLAGVDVQAVARPTLSTTIEPRGRVVRQLADRLLERADDDRRTGALVGMSNVSSDRAGRVEQCDAAARNDALSRAARVTAARPRRGASSSSRSRRPRRP